MPLRLAPGDVRKLEQEKQEFRTKLATAINDEDDPLAVYDQFIQWTLKTYGEDDPNSGLSELLEQATKEFKEDPLYKTDLRYLKLWSLYARQVDRSGAIAIYAYLVSNEIGTSYSVLYEEYATLLEADGRRQEAEMIYRKGIKRRARPLERLKHRYRDFQGCSASPPTSPSSSSPAVSTNPQTNALPRNPLKNHGGPSSSSSSSSSTPATSASVNPVSLNSTPESRYAHMLAPPDPGKRPEKPRFNFSLLFTDGGVEYSIQEARARSMGLLGKKWGPPPVSEFTSAASSSVPVDFNEDGQRSTLVALGGRRKSVVGGAEPTVTINTKEALADVFGMYNSPEKTARLTVPGSKYAPLRKVEPMTPAVSQKSVLNSEDENPIQSSKTPTPAFRPFADENAQPARTIPGLAKFTPFIDPDSNKTPVITPRTALSFKNLAAPASNPKSKEHVSRDANNVLRLRPVPEDPSVGGVFSSKVFIPAETKPPPLAPLRDAFTDDHGKPQPKPKHTHERAKSHHDALKPAPEDLIRASAFTPFIDEHAKTPFKVFSRPPEQSENYNAFTPKTSTFTPFSDPKPTFTPFKDAAVAFKPYVEEVVEQVQPVPDRPGLLRSNAVVEIEDSVREEQGQDDYQDNDGEPHEPYDASLDVEGEYEGEPYQEIPLGGRFGQFNVMTPITERTFEYTSSTRGGSTPSERLCHGTEDRGPTYKNDIPQYRDEHGAALAAEQLVAELREDGREEYDGEDLLEPLQLSSEILPQRDDPAIEIIDKTGSLSLGDTLTLNSKFRPPNPCNPFDPSILMTLLTRIPTDPHYHDLRDKESNMLDGLQRFAKHARKTSGNTSNTDLSTCFPLTLDNHKFSVLEKLGEGGFGAVFKARDLGTPQDDEDTDEDLDDYEDEDGSSMVALKVVKPRNLWEYHVLRRLNSPLPAPLRRSVILPHALYAFRDESYLVLELCRQGTLLNIVNNAVAAGVSQQGACLDELLVMFFSIELFRLLEGIHNIGFIHGDLKIDNCLLRLEDVPGSASAWSSIYQPSGEGGWSYKGLKIIDFGRTIDTRLFPPGQQYIADWATDDRDCFELQGNGPWTFQTDYFGLAGIIYCMLYGKYIQASSIAATTSEKGARYKISTPMKRYWQTGLWNRIFDVLLNSGSARKLPVSDELGSLRVEMEAWLQANCNRTSNTLKGLLKKVEVSCLIR